MGKGGGKGWKEWKTNEEKMVGNGPENAPEEMERTNLREGNSGRRAGKGTGKRQKGKRAE